MTNTLREKLEENLRIVAAIKQRVDCKPGANGKVICPKCGSNISWSCDTRYVRAKCETPGCLSGCMLVRR